MRYDVVIRGGTVVDGTGAPARSAEPELIHDLPDGGPRLVQRAQGIAWSFVNGRAVIRDGRMPAPPDARGAGRVLRPAAV